MKYVFYTTNACTNDCILCCFSGENYFGFHHVGSNDTERKGLENLFRGIGKEYLSLTGKDPLRNETVLELALKCHKGEKGIIINPLTFLCIELNKRASSINRQETQELTANTRNHGISEKSKNLAEYLSKFDYITLSNGNMQGPNPEIVDYAKIFFKENISPIMKRKSHFRSPKPLVGAQTINGQFKGGKLVDSDYLRCVGKFREVVESGKIDSALKKAAGMTDAEFKCTDEHFKFYFKKESGKLVMYRTLCSQVGHTPYTSLKTSLTLGRACERNLLGL